MAACPALSPLPHSGRRPIALTQRRLQANRRNAARSTGPRTADGKARVARNAIKHGFFAAQERWTPGQHRDFEATLTGLREEFYPQGVVEETCVRIMAESYVRMAAALRYENIAALKEHQRLDREMEQRIAAADPPEAARLRAYRRRLRRAGVWRPTIPGEREAKAIIRYLGRLDRTIHAAASRFIAQKQTHYSAAPNSGPEALRRTFAQRFDDTATPNSGPEAWQRVSNDIVSGVKSGKTNPLYARNCDVFVEEGATLAPGRETRPALLSPSRGIPCRRGIGVHGTQCAGQLPSQERASETTEEESAKTNPLSSMFTGNRHQRRRAKAMARKESRR